MVIDLSHTFTHNMPCFPGDSSPQLTQKSVAEEDGFNIFFLRSGMHVGTHIDAPKHRFSSGALFSDLPIDRFFGPGKLLDARGRTVIGTDVLGLTEFNPGDIVLIRTDWDKHFGTKSYYESYPTLSEALADELVRHQVSLVALDTPSPDRSPYPIHEILLGNNVLIAENLTNLSALEGVSAFDVLALGPKFEADAALARIVALVRES